MKQTTTTDNRVRKACQLGSFLISEATFAYWVKTRKREVRLPRRVRVTRTWDGKSVAVDVPTTFRRDYQAVSFALGTALDCLDRRTTPTAVTAVLLER